ncbi:MAG: carbamate kinase [Gammaproteobacteria bacterium]|nr:carbamate kinase [Gammaproteobacteria bacterium]
MRIVVALGGNALLRRGESLSAQNQRRNLHTAAVALAPLAGEHELIITHGNGPQVGLLALQAAAYRSTEPFPLDILDAETEGMIGYLIEQELGNLLPSDRRCVTLLTQIEVNANDPAFQHPSKPIGPIYQEDDAQQLARQLGWSIAPDGEHFRRVVASPRPVSILELSIIELLVDQQVVVICTGGGGIPVVRRADGSLVGIEAVIDKDMASALLASELQADRLLMLSDVDAVYIDWGKPTARAIRHITAAEIGRYGFAPGSMAPKVKAACEFAEHTGGIAGIGALRDVAAILNGEAGTRIVRD